ncbi:hypothetical protein ABLN67_04090 [Mycobacterium tuberculosis]
MFNRFIYRREWSFRIYRETLSRFSCAASPSHVPWCLTRLIRPGATGLAIWPPRVVGPGRYAWGR